MRDFTGDELDAVVRQLTLADALAAAVEARGTIGPTVCWEHTENCCADWCIECSDGVRNGPLAEAAGRALHDALTAYRQARQP